MQTKIINLFIVLSSCLSCSPSRGVILNTGLVNPIKQVSGDGKSFCVVTGSNNLECFGDIDADPELLNFKEPIEQISVNNNIICTLSDSKVSCVVSKWRRSSSVLAESPTLNHPFKISVTRDADVCALDLDGIHCWAYSQLGKIYINKLLKIPGKYTDLSYAGSQNHQNLLCATSHDKTLACWTITNFLHSPDEKSVLRGGLKVSDDVSYFSTSDDGIFSYLCVLSSPGARCYKRFSANRDDPFNLKPMPIVFPSQVGEINEIRFHDGGYLAQFCFLTSRELVCGSGKSNTDWKKIVLDNPSQLHLLSFALALVLTDSGVVGWYPEIGDFVDLPAEIGPKHPKVAVDSNKAKILTNIHPHSPTSLSGNLIRASCKEETDRIVLDFTSVNTNLNCHVTFRDQTFQTGKTFCEKINNKTFSKVLCVQDFEVFDISTIYVDYSFKNFILN